MKELKFSHTEKFMYVLQHPVIISFTGFLKVSQIFVRSGFMPFVNQTFSLHHIIYCAQIILKIAAFCQDILTKDS
jgi:hypothetical protein